jgi:hypothetical protein
MFTTGIHNTDFENKPTCFYGYPLCYHYHLYEYLDKSGTQRFLE